MTAEIPPPRGVGVRISKEPNAGARADFQSFSEGLRAFGYEEGQTTRIEQAGLPAAVERGLWVLV